MKNIGFTPVIVILFVFLAGFLFFSSCNQNGVKRNNPDKGAISISGAFALYPLTVLWAEEFNKSYPDIRVDISAGGAGKGMADVLAGMVDLAMFSRDVLPAETERGAWSVAVAKDAVVPVVNSANPFIEVLMKHGLNKDMLETLYTSEMVTRWSEICPGISQESKVHNYTRSDACGAAQVWAKYLNSNQEQLQGIGVFGDPGMAEAVKKDVLGLGYNNMAYMYDIDSRAIRPGLAVIPIDLNKNGVIDDDERFYGSLDSLLRAIQRGAYPAPPARDLFFISNGTPKNEQVRTFLNWVLTHGQQYISRAGYVNLSEEQITEQKQKLHNESH
ncbi:MAG: substrate-binding domain-containing protein [Bacteroidetes bacterium]|nr:substrate-binding domain-containing protein [Bacteroidota bacterium]